MAQWPFFAPLCWHWHWLKMMPFASLQCQRIRKLQLWVYWHLQVSIRSQFPITILLNKNWETIVLKTSKLTKCNKYQLTRNKFDSWQLNFQSIYQRIILPVEILTTNTQVPNQTKNGTTYLLILVRDCFFLQHSLLWWKREGSRFGDP